jgi:hypothetical protein
LLQARAYLRGKTPRYWFDFIDNRALFAGEDVGAIADVPNLSGTLDLGAGGHRIDGVDNRLVVTGLSLAYPLTLWAEFTRSVDTGALEGVMSLDDGDDTDRAMLYVSAADKGTANAKSANSTVYNAASLASIALDAPTKMAARFQADNMRAAMNNVLSALDSTAAAPATSTTLRFGTFFNGTDLNGRIRRAAIIMGPAADAELQGMTPVG